MPLRRPRLQTPLTVAASVLATTALAACGGSGPTLQHLYGDSGDRQVFIDTGGQGSQTLYLATTTPAPKIRRLTIVVSCTGPGRVRATIKPGGEQMTAGCQTGKGSGSASLVAGPADLPVPRTVTLTTTKSTKWEVLVANPEGAIGVATSP